MKNISKKYSFKIYCISACLLVAVGSFLVKDYSSKRKEEYKQIEEANVKESLLEDKQLKEEQVRHEVVSRRALEEARARTEAKAKELEKSQNEKTKTQSPPPSVNPTPKPSNPLSQLPSIPTRYSIEYLSQVENEIVSLCNKERAKVGLGPLVMNDTLKMAARYKSNEMLQYNYFDHTSPITGFKPYDIVKKLGYNYTNYGENIWMTEMKGLDPNNASQITFYRANITAQYIVNNWMNSEGHKANILNNKFNRIGVGVAYSVCGRTYATQTFSN